MKAAFLNNNPDKVRWVYSDDVIAKLSELTELDRTIYTAEDLASGKADLSETEIIFTTWKMPALTEEEIRRYLPKAKAVFYAAGSVQYFARPFLACGVRVFSAWAANAVPVAEFAAAQIVLANKGYFAVSNAHSLEERRGKKLLFPEFPGNYDTKVGIIGAGMVGKQVIERLKSYQLETLVFDPFQPDETAAALGVKKVGLQELFASCFAVSNHLANNEQTKGMLRGEHFAAMPKNATFINTGRGAQVAEDELIAVLEARPDLHVLLDVTLPEPPAADSPFYRLPNVHLTPHIAGSSGREVVRMAEYMAEECKLYLSGKKTRYEVTEKMLETMA